MDLYRQTGRSWSGPVKIRNSRRVIFRLTDGYLSSTNWDTGDLQLIDLKTGERQDVTGGGYHTGEYAWTSAFSADGRRLAASWYLENQERHELRLTDLDGRDSRVLVPARPELNAVDALDWSRSNQEILVATQRLSDRVWQIGIVSASSGSLRILKDLSWPAPGGYHSYPKAKLSPDGDYAAFDYPPDLEEHARDIYALTVDRGNQTRLVSGPADDRFLGWFPNGRGILFYSDRSGVPDVWRLTVQSGLPHGEPELVRSDIRGVVPLGLTPDGFAYGVMAASPKVHLVRRRRSRD